MSIFNRFKRLLLQAFVDFFHGIMRRRIHEPIDGFPMSFITFLAEKKRFTQNLKASKS